MREFLTEPTFSWADVIVIGAVLIPAIHGDYGIAAIAAFAGAFALGLLESGGSDA